MGQYKVPQNVEAEDRLLGPLSFRQFIYAMIAIGAGALAYFFATSVAPPLAIIPLPVFFVFLILALPLRKDQPMETYLAAMIRFWFKPHLRTWESDSESSFIEISEPKVDDTPIIKDFDAEEARRRLSFLSDVSDTQGWSTRGLGGTPINNSLTDDFVAATYNAPDILDSNDSMSQRIDDKLYITEQHAKQAVIANMKSQVAPAIQPTTLLNNAQSVFQPAPPARTQPVLQSTSRPAPQQSFVSSITDSHSTQTQTPVLTSTSQRASAPTSTAQTQSSVPISTAKPQDTPPPADPTTTPVAMPDPTITSEDLVVADSQKPSTETDTKADIAVVDNNSSVGIVGSQEDKHSPEIEESEIVLH